MDDIRMIIDEKKEEELFEIVKKYLNEKNKKKIKVNYSDICRETRVPRTLVEKWVKEERLEDPNNPKKNEDSENKVETSEERRKRLLQNLKVMVDEEKILKQTNKEPKKEEPKKKNVGFYSREKDD